MDSIILDFLLKYWQTILATGVLLIMANNYLRNNNNKNNRMKAKRVSLNEELPERLENDNMELMSFLESKNHIPYSGPTICLPGGASKFYEIANNRRSVRKFSEKSFDYEILKKCIHAAGTSPSGAHTQPWIFCVIQDQNIKEQIRDIIEKEEYINYTQRMSKQWTTDLKPFKTNHIKEYLTEAPYLILVFKQIFVTLPDGKRHNNYYNEIAVPISIGILLSAIQCAGLCSLVTTPLNCGRALRELLDRPSNEKLEVLLPVGYPADDCMIPDLERKSIDEILVKY